MTNAARDSFRTTGEGDAESFFGRVTGPIGARPGRRLVTVSPLQEKVPELWIGSVSRGPEPIATATQVARCPQQRALVGDCMPAILTGPSI